MWLIIIVLIVILVVIYLFMGKLDKGLSHFNTYCEKKPHAKILIVGKSYLSDTVIAICNENQYCYNNYDYVNEIDNINSYINVLVLSSDDITNLLVLRLLKKGNKEHKILSICNKVENEKFYIKEGFSFLTLDNNSNKNIKAIIIKFLVEACNYDKKEI